MKRMFLLFSAILLAVALLTGCVNRSYTQVVNSWKGASIDDLFHIWGYPTRINKLGGGHKILVYSDLNVSPGCQTYFELDASNRVIHVSYSGNNCAEMADRVQRYQRGLIKITTN